MMITLDEFKALNRGDTILWVGKNEKIPRKVASDVKVIKDRAWVELVKLRSSKTKSRYTCVPYHKARNKIAGVMREVTK